MEELAKQILPQGYGYSWSGMSFQEKLAGNAQIYVFTFVTIVVFLVLAALYESWILPLMILVITSYSIHYTKLYEPAPAHERLDIGRIAQCRFHRALQIAEKIA